MPVIYLALGSNVGDSNTYINESIQLLKNRLTDTKEAPRYTSKAVGYTDQADFINTAIRANTNLSPKELLDFVKSVEEKVGRIKRFRWGPREIDVDIIFYDDQIINETGLHIPHARFSERDFVLKPLRDLAPNFVDPRSKQTVKALLDKLPPSELSIYRAMA
ncbi:MAG TPA: 2-amino-4-hydroxy-6-hydroxymethyldihydropteridine diphosphokinase [Candidatus Saccharimonadia bacterium]|nr:2-amino-4-hydroxy-6-hydroxymethyldihydropteridine diphosphokinase [Candidatus Saccharimonadia bacterium]